MPNTCKGRSTRASGTRFYDPLELFKQVVELGFRCDKGWSEDDVFSSVAEDDILFMEGAQESIARAQSGLARSGRQLDCSSKTDAAQIDDMRQVAEAHQHSGKGCLQRVRPLEQSLFEIELNAGEARAVAIGWPE